MTFEQFKDMVLYHRIIEWNENSITLDNGVKIAIEETEQDCCASAEGEFTAVTLDAAITNVSKIEYTHWEDYDTYGCKAIVTFLHNRNIICKAEADADAGNGGYYYSVASFVVQIPKTNKIQYCHFVSSDDE